MKKKKSSVMLPKLTKKYLLDNLTPDEIFGRYFNLPLHEISWCVQTGGLIESAVRSQDAKPSMGFKERLDGKLVCRDFGGYFWGDCFDAVAYVKNLDIRNGHHFNLILEDIAKEFSLHKFAHQKGVKVVQTTAKRQTRKNIPKPELVIEVQIREWEKEDAHYWAGRYALNRQILSDFSVYPLNHVWINNRIVYTHKQGDPAYGYYFGRREDARDLWKVYFPLRKEWRWMTNCDVVQGISNISKADIGVITKSYKDVLCLSLFGLQGIAPPSESVLLTDVQMEYIKSHWKTIFTLTDFDLTGVVFANKMRKRYGTIPLFLTNGMLGSVNFEVKDLSDYIEKFGIDQARLLVDYALESTHELDETTYQFITQTLKHSFGR